MDFDAFHEQDVELSVFHQLTVVTMLFVMNMTMTDDDDDNNGDGDDDDDDDDS